ncbi:hypothetical protein ANCDUO_11655, partial [Ancylostoma duodenale]
FLSLNVTIRDEHGLAFDPDSISFLQTYTEHQNAQKRVASDSFKTDTQEKPVKTFCLLLRVQCIELQMKYNCEISMVLYDMEAKRFNFMQADIGRRLVLITRVAHISPVEHTSSTLKRNQEPGPPNLYCRQNDIRILISTQIFTNSLSDLRLKRPYLFTRNPPAILSRCDYAGPASGTRSEKRTICYSSTRRTVWEIIGQKH